MLEKIDDLYFSLSRFISRKSWKIKAKTGLYYYNLLEFFDKSPEQKKGESVEQYVLRVNKKYGIRLLNLKIKIFKFYNIFEIDGILEKETDDLSRDILKLMKDYGAKRIRYIMLRDKLRLEK